MPFPHNTWLVERSCCRVIQNAGIEFKTQSRCLDYTFTFHNSHGGCSVGYYRFIHGAVPLQSNTGSILITFMRRLDDKCSENYNSKCTKSMHNSCVLPLSPRMLKMLRVQFVQIRCVRNMAGRQINSNVAPANISKQPNAGARPWLSLF